MFLAGSCGRAVGREMKLSLKCLKFETGPRGKAVTSTRSTPNSGSCLILTLWLRCHLCVFTVLNQPFCIMSVASHSSCVSPTLSGCLSRLSFHSFPPSQDIFPPKCVAYVGSMPVSSCPSPHHHHTLDALWLSLQRSAWRHQWVFWLWSQVPRTACCLVSCWNKGLFKRVNVCLSSHLQTLLWTRRRQWSLLWTLPVEWPFCTRLNRWSLVTISTARVSWWE